MWNLNHPVQNLFISRGREVRIEGKRWYKCIRFTEDQSQKKETSSSDWSATVDIALTPNPMRSRLRVCTQISWPDQDANS